MKEGEKCRLKETKSDKQMNELVLGYIYLFFSLQNEIKTPHLPV